MATQLYNTLFNHPFYVTRFNIPETFGRCLGYEAQIHCLLCMIDEIVGAAWVSPEELTEAVTNLTQKINDLEKKLQNEINNLTKQLNDYITQNNNRVTNLENSFNTFKNDTNNRLNKLEGDVSNLTKSLNDLTQAFNTYKNSSGTDITNLMNFRNSVSGSVYGAELNPDGTLTLPNGTHIPVGDLNWFAANSAPANSTYANALRSRDLNNSDVKAV